MGGGVLRQDSLKNFFVHREECRALLIPCSEFLLNSISDLDTHRLFPYNMCVICIEKKDGTLASRNYLVDLTLLWHLRYNWMLFGLVK